VKAAVLHGPSQLVCEEVPDPTPGPGEYVLKVHASGLCGTDVHKVVHADVPLPAVLGHEIAGTVAATGPGCAWQVGQRVVVTHHVPCFVCHHCRRGQRTLCPQYRATNLDPGGFAEFLRVPELHARATTRLIPDGVGDEAAAFTEPLTCCLLGTRRADIGQGDRVLVLGAGGVGQLFIQIAVGLMARQVIATDLAPGRLRLATRSGADVVIPADVDDLPAAVRDATQGHGADVVVVTASVPRLISQGVACAARGGRVLVFGGFDRGTLTDVDAGILMWDQVSVIGSYSSDPNDIDTALALLESGRVRTDHLVSGRFGLDAVDRAIEASKPSGGPDFVKALVVPALTGRPDDGAQR
jgi:L-iditol 2-dehydrogenase